MLEAHPKDPRLLLSSGHDGNIILWNLLTGKLVKKFHNKVRKPYIVKKYFLCQYILRSLLGKINLLI